MEARVFCAAVDVVDDLNAVLDDIARLREGGRPGRSAGIILAASYHQALDFLPRNARRRVHYSPAGLAFRPDLTRYPAAIPALPQLPVCAGQDILAAAVSAAHGRGIRTDAWVVYLHHDGPDLAATSGRTVNAFGDIYPVALCPAAPAVRDYARALTADVCSHRPDGIFAEALHHQPLAHGFHHERAFARFGGLARFLLGICFCPSCIAAAKTAGLDVTALRAWIRALIDGPAVQAPLPRLAELLALADSLTATGTLASYLGLRDEHTTRLVQECAELARSKGAEFVFFDATHALAEVDAAASAGVDEGWQIGVDLRALSPLCEVATASYVESAEQVTLQLAETTTTLGRPPDGVILRALGGDLRDGLELGPAVRTARAALVSWIGYYHYGLAPKSFIEDAQAVHSTLF